MEIMEKEQLRRTIEDLHTRYIHVIDQDHLEEWPDLFTETCLYKIITRENFDQGLPLAIMECRSRGMMQDRVTGLRRINFYEPHRYLHQISGLIIQPLDDHRVQCRSNYLVVRTTTDGAMILFSAGIYLDKVLLGDEGARFEERIVVPDSRRIETLLVIPL
jgi:anthranilate 1,2-dioxygenase small subunit